MVLLFEPQYIFILSWLLTCWDFVYRIGFCILWLEKRCWHYCWCLFFSSTHRWFCSAIIMGSFFRGLNEDSGASQLNILRCPFLRNINEPTNFSFASSLPFPMPVSYLFLLTYSFRSGIFAFIRVLASSYCATLSCIACGFPFCVVPFPKINLTS